MERFFCETKRILMILLAIFLLVVVMMPNESEAVTQKEILNIARDTFNQIVIRDGKPYSQTTGHTVAWPYKSSTIDCSSYLGVVLYRLGYTEFGGPQKNSEWWYKNSDSTIQKYGWESFYIQSKSDISKLRPGDILAFNGQIKGNYSLVCPTSPGNKVNHVQIVDSVNVKEKKVNAWDCGWHPVTYKLGPDTSYNAWFWGYYGTKGVKVIRITSENTVKATSVKMNRDVCMVQEGKTWWLSATVSPADATNKTITWTSSNNEVAEIKNGQIIAKKAGEATITATTANGHKTTCKVYVYNSLTGRKTVKVGNKMKLDGSYKQYTICTPSVANIQSDNYLYGIKIGSAILRYVGNNNQALYYQVNVIENIQQATGVKLNRNVCMVQEGKTWWLTATVEPADATNKSLTWTSSNEKVATVKNGQIIAQKAGEATITATTANGHKTTCKVYVYNSIVAVKTIKKGQNVSLGERFDQYMTCTPKIAYIKDGNVLCGIEKGSVILRCVINRDRNAGAYYYLVKVE